MTDCLEAAAIAWTEYLKVANTLAGYKKRAAFTLAKYEEAVDVARAEFEKAQAEMEWVLTQEDPLK